MGIDGFAAMYAGWGAQTIENEAYGWQAHVQLELALSQNTQLGQQWQDNTGGVIQPLTRLFQNLWDTHESWKNIQP
jgi:hypothetical protein